MDCPLQQDTADRIVSVDSGWLFSVCHKVFRRAVLCAADDALCTGCSFFVLFTCSDENGRTKERPEYDEGREAS